MSTSRSEEVNKFVQTKKRNLIISRTINSKESACKKRIMDEYLPKYRQKLNLERKVVFPPSEDRLSELTIKQIDRLIEMEKIKDLLHDNKKGIKPTHICSLQKYPTRHPNVYQPNFLAKINRIAMARNIKRLRSQQFDETVLSPQQLRERGLLMQKRNLRYVKQYKTDTQKKKKVSTYEEKQQKSIGSIEDKLSDFQISLEDHKSKKKGKSNKQSLKKYKMRDTNILSSKRWFNGMSTFYVDFQERMRRKEDREKACFTQPIEYSRGFDFEYDETPTKKSRHQFAIQYSRLSTMAT